MSNVIENELPIIQATYDLIKWYVPILNRLPRNQQYLLGNRIIIGLYELLENLIKARYAKDKLPLLGPLNSQLDILRYQTRLLVEFHLMSTDRYEYVCQRFNSLGMELGGWIKQQQQRRIQQKQ